MKASFCAIFSLVLVNPNFLGPPRARWAFSFNIEVQERNFDPKKLIQEILNLNY